MKRHLKWATHGDLAIRRSPSVDRAEYLDFMTFRRNERPLFTEIFGPIVGLKEEWEAQGASAEELDFSAFCYRCEPRASVAVTTGRIVERKPLVIDETDEYVITKDDIGRSMKLAKGTATIPLPLDFPVRNYDDWLRIKRLYMFDDRRFAVGWEEKARADAAAGRVVTVSIPGGYDEPRELLGEVELSYAFYDQPELIHDILRTIADTAFAVLDRVSSRVQVDMLSVHEDMAGKSGPLVGPDIVREFIAPYYRRTWNLLSDRGARLFDQDSDGNMNPVIEPFIEAGVNMMHPFEPAAGMDVLDVRRTYGGRLAMYGGIDKHVLRTDKSAIDAELERKLPPLIHGGGYQIALDHRIPNGTPLEHYRYYHAKVWEIMERERPS